MLFSFRVKNYRSIRDEQTLSFKRAGQTRLPDDSEELACGQYSPVEVIFGANASGKSNVIEALRYVQRLVSGSADRPVDKPLPNRAFKLDGASENEPTEYYVHFSTKDLKEYEYSIAIQNGNVLSEKLCEIIHRDRAGKGRQRDSTRTLFSRNLVEPSGEGERFSVGAKPDIRVSSYLPGAKKAIREATRNNVLFLSKAAKENFEPLMGVYRWFVPSKSIEDHFADAMALFDEDAGFRSWVTNLLESSDLGVSKVEVKSVVREIPGQMLESITQSEGAKAAEEFKKEFGMIRQPMLYHESADNRAVPFSWNAESLGTTQLWNYAAALYESLSEGLVHAVDEFVALHPMLLRKIIEIFQSKKTNPNGAQLLFTSHDIVLLGNWGGMGYLLDADQVYFTEKGNDGATDLYSLADFGSLEGRNIEKMYLQGKLGATPLLGNGPQTLN
ncbi:MAG: AAA family ATPase [Bifidobacterium sp.]|nr:AAA family ATPase [Bifidobacterium sp.]